MASVKILGVIASSPVSIAAIAAALSSFAISPIVPSLRLAT